ncbi:hypothetical protein NDU88_003576 [Pleurodeles waltl]|uniref:Uncharacterized protein n=1 Tax=Pleurodeles waltl TaxID=8319 RepID=A0AAV7TNV5_PLEWA|nr:hypothetical protein NDU88_003576 [Pleurodeles waltl]
MKRRSELKWQAIQSSRRFRALPPNSRFILDPPLITRAPAPMALVLRSPPRGMQPERGISKSWGVRLCLFVRAHGPTWCFSAAGEKCWRKTLYSSQRQRR